MAIPARRLTRVQSKALTRRRLLDAARTVFLRDGFHGTTVDQIAAEAGFTKGAVYSAFAGKADLFLALYEERHAERARIVARIPERHPAGERSGAGARTWIEVLRRERDWLLVLIEFWTHAARDPELRARFGVLHARTRETIAAAIEAGAREAGHDLPADAVAIARAHMALGNGFALEALLDPAVVAGDEFEAAYVALAHGIESTLRPPSRRVGKGAR
jgi:AcrR family transcriptional regulator